MGLTIGQWSEKIKRKLGYPTVNVELTPDQLKDAVEDAFNYLVDYMVDDDHYLTIPYANRVDLSDKKIDFIAGVFKGTEPVDESLEAAMFNQSFLYTTTDYQLDVPGIVSVKLRAMIADSLKEKMSYRFIDGILYMDQGYPIASTVVIQYSPIIEKPEDINDNYWNQLLFKLALAHAKQTLGRIRSKIKVNNAPYELDGDTLLSEGREEEQQVKDQMENQFLGFYPTN